MSVTQLRFGMVGGGNGGNIGNSHRRGAAMDSLAVLSAGCFTRNFEQNKKDGAAWGVAPDRIYRDYKEMAEAESQREDGIDFVSIVTPNFTHYEIAKTFLEHGIHVSCEKPFTMTVAEAEELRDLAAAKGLEICLTYTYAHYPVLQQARRMVADGRLGRLISVVAEYPQDWLMLEGATDPSNYASWFMDPKKAGMSNATAAIGVHVWYLIKSMTGQPVDRVLADFAYYPEDAALEAASHTLFRLADGTRGLLWDSITAAGHDCDIGIKIYGEKGSLEWTHCDPIHLRVAMKDGPVEIYSAERAYLDPHARAASRLPAGHPEGFYEAFANIYRAFCTHLLDKKNGVDGGGYFHPTAQDGVDGMRFVAASVKSYQEGNVWVRLDEV
ncbi:Gfo/Idh/MocA family oxidoreductase [Intestinibacillus massiliensis]|uniref:Gfo/Idh/MocA family protein n=1 Tax=Intestinibacillus massiliensis TaxID=1871029 RepID=UPI000B35D623|nr:Gfo/Idh/MocA family oxidoreductase [Intestinibacillus massiliensis]MCB6366810.1 Gfo/Idh/MocA family oxidoreductase [Intestinibacillus massiliensis]